MRTTGQPSQAIETWLREEVAAAYDALVADPSRLSTTDEVRARLAKRQETRD